MMNHSLETDQRGLSNVIIGLIVISMAIGGGFVVYRAFRGYLGSSTANVNLRVQYVKAIQVTGGQDIATATVKNTGTARVENVVVKILNSKGDDVMLEVGDLNPGQTGSDRKSHGLAAGVTYPVVVSASTAKKKDAIHLTLEVRVS